MTKFNPARIQGIFLDLDDTLYDYPSCNTAGNQAVLKFLSNRFHRSLREVEMVFKMARRKTKEHLQHPEFEVASSHSRLLYFQKTIEALSQRTHASLTLQAEELFWNTFQNKMELLPGAKRFLKKSREQKKLLVIVTDMTAQIQLQKLVTLGIEDLIDFIVSSEEAGKEKPHPAALLIALEKTNLAPENVVMIGEDEKRDIEAARRTHVTPLAVRYRPADPSILFAENFAQLEKLLGL